MKKSSVLLLVCIVSATLIVLARCFAATSAPGETTLVGRYQRLLSAAEHRLTEAPGETTLVGRYQLFQGSYTERKPVVFDRKVIFLLDTITGKVKRYSTDTSEGNGVEKWSDIDYPTK